VVTSEVALKDRLETVVELTKDSNPKVMVIVEMRFVVMTLVAPFMRA
jgi:hypothetical protein